MQFDSNYKHKIQAKTLDGQAMEISFGAFIERRDLPKGVYPYVHSYTLNGETKVNEDGEDEFNEEVKKIIGAKQYQEAESKATEEILIYHISE